MPLLPLNLGCTANQREDPGQVPSWACFPIGTTRRLDSKIQQGLSRTLASCEVCQLWAMVLFPQNADTLAPTSQTHLSSPGLFQTLPAASPFVPDWQLSVSESWAGSELGLQWAQAQTLDPKGHCAAERQVRRGHGGGSDGFW